MSVKASASFITEAERCLVNKADNYNMKEKATNVVLSEKIAFASKF